MAKLLLRVLFLLVVLFPVACPGVALAVVSGQYLASDNSTIRMQITITNPKPRGFILEQIVPKGIQIFATTPKPTSYNRRNGIIRWLFRGLRVESFTVTVHVKQPLKKAFRENGKIIYPKPGGKGMVENPLQPAEDSSRIEYGRQQSPMIKSRLIYPVFTGKPPIGRGQRHP
ncbi:MAG: hypothetical protein DSY80_09990 [Desulfocapsa sp.]|nr:MAG: hypothetical protein DSY80_09990 [Desulfocapsa sp.]